MPPPSIWRATGHWRNRWSAGEGFGAPGTAVTPGGYGGVWFAVAIAWGVRTRSTAAFHLTRLFLTTMPVLRTSRHLLRTFMLGLLAALPLAATALVLVWAVRLVNELLGPSSLVGRALAAIGLGVTGSEVAGYTIGLGLVLLAIFVLGLLVQTRLKDALTHGVQRVVQRIPLVGTLYDLVHKFVGLLAKKEGGGPGTMSPIWLHFGGPGGAAVLGLLSTPEPIDMNGQPYLAVLLPTAPVPVGGALLYVPQHWVTPAPLGMEALTSVYVSMGLTSAQHLPAGAKQG